MKAGASKAGVAYVPRGIAFTVWCSMGLGMSVAMGYWWLVTFQVALLAFSLWLLARNLGKDWQNFRERFIECLERGLLENGWRQTVNVTDVASGEPAKAKGPN